MPNTAAGGEEQPVVMRLKVVRVLAVPVRESYHEYQGPQYEPGGYAGAVQQRSNMTQREDALKFEQGRIRALQEERLHIQKKTFTKWINSFLQKARMEVEDLFVDLGDGRRLLKLLEIISGERLPRPNTGRMRVHKIENVNKSLSFLHTKVRLESIGAEDIVDGNPRLILGLIWTIILRFQIQEIEIDVDEENESSEKKSAKDALLLWCQRKTSGYHGVHIHNFTDSWRSGLGFNALIHAHRPDLFRWADVPREPVETLNHAFDVAHNHLGIPKLLDAEDVDTSRPDEKSVMTYVASYYHTFARMKNEQKSGRRIANIIGQLMECDALKEQYSRLVSELLAWIKRTIEELARRDLPNSLHGIQQLLLTFKQYRTVEKPPKYKERSEIEALYFAINTMQKSLTGDAWAPLDGQLPQDLERAWQHLEQAEHARELALRTELLRQQRLEQLNYKFNTKSVLRKGYLKEMIAVLSDPRYGSNLAQVDATVKKHEAISADILARTERFEDLSAMAAELVREQYHGAEAVSRTEKAVLARWEELLQLLEKHRVSLSRLAHLMSLIREADTVAQTVQDMKAQFTSEETGRQLADVERLAQAHALQELQLGALHDTLRRLLRHAAQAKSEVEGAADQHQPANQLAHRLAQLEDDYDSLVAAAKDRKARLEEARSLYQFLEDHDEEEAWVSEKRRVCMAEVAAKDGRAAAALRQNHAALLHEIKARDRVCQKHIEKGRSLIEAGHPKRAEIDRRVCALSAQWAELRQLADRRDKLLGDAQEAHQFYGDANEAESWIKEKRPLVTLSDCGRDAHAAAALLQRHRNTHDEIRAYSAEIDALHKAAKRLQEAGITRLQLPTEVESTPAEDEEEEWVKESRLVPTEVWEEEPVERLEHRTVTEERSVPQVKALYPFTGQGISVAKGEVMFLISKTNPDWWSVRKADRTDGFVPANYVREIEPRLVPVQVRRPEKVRTVQRVKKTVLVKQVVAVRRARPPAPRRAPPHLTPPLTDIPQRVQAIHKDYDELLSQSAARRNQLEEAIKLFSFFAECDDFDKWIKDKEKMLRADDEGESVDTAKRKYEKFVTDLSAASKRLEGVTAAAEELTASRHPQAERARQRRQQLQDNWDRLCRLKQQKEKSLEGASSVEVFKRTCEEALEWMREKEQQLAGAGAEGGAGHDLRSARQLQRRHAQLERELEPLSDRVRTIDLLARDVKSQYPNERASVERGQQEMAAVWERCVAAAQARRARLETAVGQQVYRDSARTLRAWMQSTQEQINQEASAKDVATAEALRKQHQELQDDIQAHEDEYKEVAALGRQLAARQELPDVADSLRQLEDHHHKLHNSWQAKDEYLKQLVQLANFNREADHIDAATGAHEAFLQYNEFGSSVDEAEALLKRHSELEARLLAQEERVTAFTQKADALVKQPHPSKEHIQWRCAAVVKRREAVKAAAADRRHALQGNLQHHQFIASTEELQEWIREKTALAQDESYRDLPNLERRLQRHGAFERELQANERQLAALKQMGQTLHSPDDKRSKEVSERLQALDAAWAHLGAASRDKGAKLRQAQAQRNLKRSIEDVRARVSELERALRTEETGADLRSCRRLLTKHQALEQEVAQCEQKAEALVALGADLVSGGHFDAAAISRETEAILQAAKDLRPLAAKRRQALESSMQLHKFAAEVQAELSWLTERKPGGGEVSPADLHGAQTAQKNHLKLKAELKGRRPHIEKVLAQGKQRISEGHPQSDKIKSLCTELEDAYSTVSSAAEALGAKLEGCLRAQQFLQDALEVEAWLADKAAALATPDVGQDRHRATQLLTKHKAVELELDTYAAIIAEMGHAAAAMQSGGHPDGARLVDRHGQLADALSRLQRQAAARQRALVDSVCRHEYMAESAELEEWIGEQLAAASSEDYGQDYEHLLILRSKFEELRHRVESGAERFSQCEELAHKLAAGDSVNMADIEARQEALGEKWQRLVEAMESRASRLHAAGEIHRYHRDVSDALGRAANRRRALGPPHPPRTLRQAHDLIRDHDTIENDLVAIDAQIQVLQEEGARLQKLYPGGNVQRISQQRAALDEAWSRLRTAAAHRRTLLHQYLQLQQFLTQVRDLCCWCTQVGAEMCGAVSVRDVSAAQEARAQHAATRAEIDARHEAFEDVLAAGQQLIADGHPNAQEIEEKCELVSTERQRLAAAWGARQVALDQLSDLHCFLRDAAHIHRLCAAQEPALGTEISPTLSVEEVDNLLKKHEAFEKLLATQDEKLSTLNSHGDKLLQQNHVESDRIAAELSAVNDRRRKLHELSAARREKLVLARARAQFARDAAEARSWAADKLANLLADQQHGEVTNLEAKIKKLQKHQAFTAELAAHRTALREVERLAAQLGSDEDVKRELESLRNDWEKLEKATEERGRGLEEAQDILEFNQQLDKIEAWIRDKEMMVQAHELGEDYEHCSALLRKLDDLDSDMKVDDGRVKTICALADKLLQQGPTQQADAVSSRRDAFVRKWRALSGALQKYRDNLTAALEIHAFNRDVEETKERIWSQGASLSSSLVGRDLAAAMELRRRHAASLATAQAANARIDALQQEGNKLKEKYPERSEEIDSGVTSLHAAWARLGELAERRANMLDEAIAEHKFEETLKELEVWVSETVKRMSAEEPPHSVSDAHALLELHRDRKAEIDNKQKAIAALQKEAEQSPEKLKRVKDLAETLDKAWRDREQYLTQAHQLQLFKEQARETEDWLAAKEAFLNNDDLGENLDAVEALLRKHLEFCKLAESQAGRVQELRAFGERLVQLGHPDRQYVQDRLHELVTRKDKLKELMSQRGVKLEQSKQLQCLLRNLHHESEWLSLKLQQARDDNYRELSNLQSKIQRHAAFESELAASKGRVDDVAAHAEGLIEQKHYASKEIAMHLEELENHWRELEAASKERRERLSQAYQARVYLRGLDEFTRWLDDVESQLLCEDHGKDLTSVTALLKRHSRLEQQVASKSETAAQLADNARQLADSGHFMADEITDRADQAVKRYRQLQEPMQIRRDNLEDAALLHRWERDALEEDKWLEERSLALESGELGGSPAETQALLKKHLATEAELIAREPTIKAVCDRATQLCRRGHFASARLGTRADALAQRYAQLHAAAAERSQRLASRCQLLQLLSEISEAEAWLQERRSSLVSGAVGTDEDSVLGLQRRQEALQAELSGFEAVHTLEKSVQDLMERSVDPEAEQAQQKVSELKSLYEEVMLLSAKRQQRLQQSLNYFKFVQECEEVQEWMSEQMSEAASEDYGLDVEHVDTLQQDLEYFLQQLHANESRIEAVCEAGSALLEDNTPEGARVRLRLEDLRGLWDDLKELALARQEALAGARQVHEFDRNAEETVAWVNEKASAFGERPAPRSLQALHEEQRRHDALMADLSAIQAQHQKLQQEADRLGALFPDAREHVVSKLEEVSEGVSAVQQRAAAARQQLQLADQLQHYFAAYQELLAWTNETLAVVTAPELGRDVAAAQRLVARHRDIRKEIDAKEEDFTTLYADGEKLIKEGHLMSGEISSLMGALRSRRAALEAAWANRHRIYTHHLDALLFKKDADALDAWIATRIPLVRDGKLGESVAQVEELISRHEELQDTIQAQQDRAHALKRITLVEQAFAEQQAEEAEQRRRSAEKQEEERLAAARRREMDRIAEERRRDAPAEQAGAARSPPEEVRPPLPRAPHPAPAPSPSSSPSSSPAVATLSPDAGVKRAESMSVVKSVRRTPSFTTRRRTQSFRRHRNDTQQLPPVDIEGQLERKQEAGVGGSRAAVRSWRGYYGALCGQILAFFRDQHDLATAQAAAPPIAILNARCSIATDYRKRAHVFRLQCADGAEYLFAAPTHQLMEEWVAKLSFHAKLPPELQLTPYADGAPATGTPQSPGTEGDKKEQESPTAELKRRLHENASSSSSSTSTPEPRRARSQTEILQQHRASLQTNSNHQPERETNIESAVLPCVPPRQSGDSPPAPPAAADTAWGRTRFSNGRDLNAEFIRSQRDAYGNTVGPRPASVAGSVSGGSPALDQRPPSRSSGESEVSVSGREKKDKKGVFGGLFSRKKRPQSHM